MTSEHEEQQGPIVRDKRRIDPETGRLREPRAAAAPPPPVGETSGGQPGSGQPVASTESAVADLQEQLAERTMDLKRLQAEYVNYKRRVDRDRNVVREQTVARVLTELLPVLDDIGRARDHGELTGGFKAVADSLERVTNGLGLESFGAEGDEFDPRVHEALMHQTTEEVSGPVCVAVLQVGYRIGERVLRAARVAVAEPPEPTHESSTPQPSADDRQADESDDDPQPDRAGEQDA